jgi:signal transduction histidine kinase
MSLKDDPSLFAGQILSVVSDMIYILDPVNNHLDFLNSRAVDLLYAEPSGPKHGFDLFHSALHEEDRQRRNRHLAACLAIPDGRAKEIDVRLRVQAGHYRKFRIRDMVFSRNPDGSVNQLTGIIRLLDAAASEENEENDLPAKLLLGIAAQDYLEGLRQIYISLEIIISTEGHLFSNANKAHLRRSQSMVQKLNLLTRDVLVNASSTATNNRSSLVDLTALLTDVLIKMNGKIKALGARVETPDLPQVHGYPLLLTALFRHLILNALKSALDGRPLLIGIQPGLSQNMPTPGPNDKGRPFLIITITDNGCGFDPADREKIFDMSYQGPEKMRYRSSSAALAIAKRIMEIHGGFIMADSIPGEGSTFTCYFPG